MEKTAVLLKKFLDSLGFTGIFKYFSAINYYNLTPYRVNESSEIKSDYIDYIVKKEKESWNLLKCLMIMHEVEYNSLSEEEKIIAGELIRINFIKHENSMLYNNGYQLISYNGLYLFIDARMNYRRLGLHQSYIGIDTYLMLYYIETEKIKGDSKCIDLCTGSGISALYLSSFSNNVIGTDIAELPLKLSQFNCYLNDKQSKITIRNEDFNKTLKNDEKFDVITCNPPFVAFPPGFEGPIFAKGYDNDGLGHYRLLFERINNILTDTGTAYFVSDFIGDENTPYFVNELEVYCRDYDLAIDLFIDNKLDAKKQVEVYPGILRTNNKNYTFEELKQKSHDFIINDLKAKFYYLSTLLIRKNKFNPVLRIFNRYKKESLKKNKEFNFADVFR